MTRSQNAGIVTRSGRRISLFPTRHQNNTNASKKKDPPRFPFLALPLEIRTMIYRLLFLHCEPISSAGAHLSATFLRTCKQILDEAQPILCGENTFLMEIWAEPRPPGVPWRFWGRFLDCRTLIQWPGRAKDGRLRRMKRWEVKVLLEREANVPPVKAGVRKICQILSDLPDLESLHIRVDGLGHQFPRILQSCTLLRRVQKVEFEGVPRVYAGYLEGKMTGKEPVDHLPKMYDALQTYAGPFEECEPSLKEACDAMENDDVEVFKNAREDIVKMVTERMREAEAHLYYHDGKGQRQQA